MLNLDGIAASMASIESALYANFTIEMAASMASIESALYAITTNESIDSTIIVLAKFYRLQESAADHAPAECVKHMHCQNPSQHPAADVCATVS